MRKAQHTSRARVLVLWPLFSLSRASNAGDSTLARVLVRTGLSSALPTSPDGGKRVRKELEKERRRIKTEAKAKPSHIARLERASDSPCCPIQHPPAPCTAEQPCVPLSRCE